ncbi:MAG: hypothetical protein R2726_20230 [Acidimicrobiales bacterium]
MTTIAPPSPESPAPPSPDPGSPSPRRRRWPVVVLALVALVVGAVGVVAVRYAERDRPEAVTSEEAVEEFRATSSTAVAPTGFVVPAAGVYEAVGQGSARISFPPNAMTDGPTMPVAVTYLPDGCWRWRISYSTAAWHEYDFCPKGDELLLVAQRNFLSFDYGSFKVDNTAQYACDPPSPIVVESPVPGRSFDHQCVGENSAAPGRSVSAGPVTIIGTETLDIGGTSVPAIHQRRTQTMSGPQTGPVTEDWWFAADTGLPLKCERHQRIETSSPIGAITFTADGSWQLTSMQPRT